VPKVLLFLLFLLSLLRVIEMVIGFAVIQRVIGFAVIEKVIISTKFNRYAVFYFQAGVVSTIRQMTDRYAIEE